MIPHQPASRSAGTPSDPVRKFLDQALRDADPDSLDSQVIRHLSSSVKRFGEEAFLKAARIAEGLAESYAHFRDIARLNDAFRQSPALGKLVMTSGVKALGEEVTAAALTALQAFDTFTQENDPWGEHDFGSFDAAGHRFFWKIDYYDRGLRFHSPNPMDPAVTTRVLTLMLPEEY